MTKQIPLSCGLFALVDDEDFGAISAFDWRAHGGGRGRGGWYAMRQEGRRTVYMHRMVMGEPDGFQVDHINRNSLDNRRANLRLCSAFQNAANRTYPRTGAYRGANAKRGKWQAQIVFERRTIFLGLYSSDIMAARAHDIASRELRGEFACPNFDDRDWLFPFETVQFREDVLRRLPK